MSFTFSASLQWRVASPAGHRKTNAADRTGRIPAGEGTERERRHQECWCRRGGKPATDGGGGNERATGSRNTTTMCPASEMHGLAERS